MSAVAFLSWAPKFMRAWRGAGYRQSEPSWMGAAVVSGAVQSVG